VLIKPLTADVRICTRDVHKRVYIQVEENKSRRCTLLLRVDYKFALRWVQIHDMAYLKVIAVDFKKKELQGNRLERQTRPTYEIKFQCDVEKFLSPSLK